MTMIYSATLFEGGAASFLKNGIQIMDNLAGRTVYYFQNLSQQPYYQRLSIIIATNVLFFYIMHQLVNILSTKMAYLRKNDEWEGLVISISQLPLNIWLSTITRVDILVSSLLALTVIGMGAYISVRSKVFQVKHIFTDGTIYEEDIVNRKYTGKGK